MGKRALWGEQDPIGLRWACMLCSFFKGSQTASKALFWGEEGAATPPQEVPASWGAQQLGWDRHPPSLVMDPLLSSSAGPDHLLLPDQDSGASREPGGPR